MATFQTMQADAIERFRIREVIELYFSAIDRRDWFALASCFHRDLNYALFDGALMLRGRDDAVERLKMVTRFVATHHAVSNVVVSLHDGGATAVTQAIAHCVTAENAGSQVLVRGLRYEDRFVRSGPTWEIAERRHTAVWQFDAARVAPRNDYSHLASR